MKLKNLLFPALCFLTFGLELNAQIKPASAVWALTNPGAGGTGQTVATAGQVTAASESFGILSINQYTGGVVGVDLAQRLRINSIYPPGTVAGWPATRTTQMNDVYIQFSISPKPFKRLFVDSIALKICGMSIATVKANVYYSKSPTFNDSVQMPYTTGLISGASTNVLPNTSMFYLSKDSLGLVINPGETLYLRVYPWIEGLAAPNATKYFCIKDVIIAGTTEPLPEPSSVLWPYDGDETFVKTGSLTPQPVSNSGSFQFLNSPTLLISGTSTSVMVGAYNLKYNWTSEVNPLDTMYIQYVVSPKYGGTFAVNDVSLYLGAINTTNLKAAVYYSKDITFTSKTLLFADSALPNNEITLKKASLNDSIKSGETMYLRVYPHNTAAESNANLVAIDSVYISGIVIGNLADPATVVNTAVTYISTTSARSGGTISTDGGAPVTARGVCWSTSANPTVADATTSNGSGTGSYTSYITSLTPGTLYHMRAYATNEAGSGYGTDVSFTTLASVVPPTVTKIAASSIMVKTALAGGNVTAWGGDTVDAKGVCWNTTGNPTIADNKTMDGKDLGSFTSTFYPLVQNTKYYFKAYATNSAGTGYSVIDSFTTQIPAADVTKIVAKDGSGDYTTIQAAFNAVPLNYTGRWTIFVKPGTYYEKDTLNAGKVNVILRSIHPDSTIITFDAFADSPKPGGGTMGTNGCFSVGINADDFTAINITFRNTIKNDATHGANEQAVALFTNADRLSFYNCRLLGYQDTYYAGGGNNMGRTYMKNCYIEGSVDYIFGKATVIFDSCEMNTNRNGGAVTAANTDPTSKFGFVFMNSELTNPAIGFNGVPVTSYFLGRPWQNSPQTVYINCYEPATISPLGWTSMQVNPLLYAEYKCFGPGSDTTSRSKNVASASRQLADAEALNYIIPKIFAKSTNIAFGYDWIPDLTIYKLTQIVNFADLPSSKYGDTLIVTASASSTLEPVTFSSSNSSIATIIGDTIIMTGAGNVNIIASQAGNFLYSHADSVKSITVGKLPLNAVIDDATKTYGDPNPVFNATYSGMIYGDDPSTFITLHSTATIDSGVGTYPITLSNASTKYDANVTNGTLTIYKASLSIKADKKSKVYGSANPVFTASYIGFVNGDDTSKLNTPVTLTTDATISSPVGTYLITPGSATSDNYSISFFDDTLNVTKAALSITADNKSKAYGASLPALAASYAGFVSGDDASDLTGTLVLATSCTSASDVGDYSITANGFSSANYNISYFAGTLTVNKVTLTATADNKTKKEGQTNPLFTITYTGFVNGDDVSDITVPSITCSADQSSGVGNYPIILSGGSAINYTINLVNGTLSVTTPDAVRLIEIAGINIYPNPAIGKVTIQRNSHIPATLTILNSLGQVVLIKRLNSEKENVDISNLGKGIYLFQVEGRNYSVVLR